MQSLYCTLDAELHSYLCTLTEADKQGNKSVIDVVSSLHDAYKNIAMSLRANNNSKNNPNINQLTELQIRICYLEEEFYAITKHSNSQQAIKLLDRIKSIELEKGFLHLAICKEQKKRKVFDLIESVLSSRNQPPSYLKLICSLALIKRLIEQITTKPTYSGIENFTPSIIRLSKGYNVHNPPAAPPRAFNLCIQIFHTVFEGTHYADFTPTRS